MKKRLLLPLLFLIALLVSSCNSSKSTTPADTFSASIDSFANGATNISQTPSIQIKFTQAVLNVNSTTVMLYQQGASSKLQEIGSPIPITDITAGSNNSYTFSPLAPLSSNTKYVIALSNGITTLTGIALTPTTFNFTTGDFIAPTVSMITPANGGTGASLSQIIQLQFSESVTNVDTTSITLHESSTTGTAVATGNITAGSNNTYSFSSTSPLSSSTTYYVVLSNAISNVAGNPLTATSFSFITGDFIAPTVSMITPINNAESVSITPIITLQFSESVTNVDTTSITLHESSTTGTVIALGDITAESNNNYSFSATSPLSPLTTYYVVLSNAITDIAGNPLSATSFSFTTIPPSWGDVGNAGFSAGAVNYTSLAIASDGTPYVAYADAGYSNKATVMKFDGTSWVTVGSAGFSAGSAAYTSLAIASNGTPYVAYQDGNNDSYKATVMMFNGTNWVNVGNPEFSAGFTFYTSLAIGSDSALYVAYKDIANSNKATVMMFDGNSWIDVGNAGFSAGGVEYTSLAIAPDGTPYVAYTDVTNGNRATVMVFNGSSWVNVGNAGFSAGSAYFISLAINSSGTPYVAYTDAVNSSQATVMKFNGTNWVNVGNAGFSAGSASYTSLAIASDGTPYVAYTDAGYSEKATVMKFNGSSWVNVGNAGFSAGGAYYASLAINSFGTPYLAYTDAGNSNKATVMSYQ